MSANGHTNKSTELTVRKGEREVSVGVLKWLETVLFVVASEASKEDHMIAVLA